MCIYIYVYICTYTYTYIYTHIHIHMYIYMYTYVHIYIHIYIHICIYAYIHIDIHVYTSTIQIMGLVYAYIQKFIHTEMLNSTNSVYESYAYIHIYIYIYIFVNTYTYVELHVYANSACESRYRDVMLACTALPPLCSTPAKFRVPPSPLPPPYTEE